MSTVEHGVAFENAGYNVDQRKSQEGKTPEEYDGNVSRNNAEKHVVTTSDNEALTLEPARRGFLRPSRVYDETSPDGFYYPEGGWQAWLVVFGSFCCTSSGFGLMNTIATFQAYISKHQLKDCATEKLAWIFGIYVWLVFFCGLQIGPIFDAKGPRALLLFGSFCVVLSMELIGLCTEYYQFILCFSILGGIGSSFLFTPAFAAVSHWLLRKRGMATGVAAAGGAFGGVIFPLMLQRLIPEVGFAWSTRILGLLFLVLCAIGNTFCRARLPPRPGGSVLPDFRIFADGTGAMALTTAGVWFLEWGFFVPATYLTTYALANGVDTALAYQLIAIYNAASCLGRWLPGYAADAIGRFNTLIITLVLCMVAALAFWLPADGSVPLIVVFSVVFGFSSGGNISLTPICVGQLCDTREYGRYYATVYTVVSIGTLVGIPIAGAIIAACGGHYYGVVLFTALCYAASIACTMAVRVMKVGWGITAVF